MSNNENFAKWLKENSGLLNMSAVCKLAGIDRSNFNKYMDSLKIPDKYIPKLKEAIKSLEYKEKLDKSFKSAVLPELKVINDLTKPNVVVDAETPPKTNYVIQNNPELAKLEAELAAIPDKTKGLGKKLAETMQKKIKELEKQQ